MDIFISWSGKKSKMCAEALRDWLPKCVQVIRPWVSFHDIEKGSQWIGNLTAQLEKTSFGIICITKSNLASPWLLFEAGAISKTASAKACTLLLDVTPANVEFPLGQFQATLATREEIYKLLTEINLACQEFSLPDERLRQTFDVWWPELESTLNNLVDEGESKTESRSDREILEEILEVVRSNERGQYKVSVIDEVRTDDSGSLDRVWNSWREASAPTTNVGRLLMRAAQKDASGWREYVSAILSLAGVFAEVWDQTRPEELLVFIQRTDQAKQAGLSYLRIPLSLSHAQAKKQIGIYLKEKFPEVTDKHLEAAG